MVQYDCGGCGHVLDYHHDVTAVTETEEKTEKVLFWETTHEVEHVVGYECTYCGESIPESVAKRLGKQYARLERLSNLDKLDKLDKLDDIHSELTGSGGGQP